MRKAHFLELVALLLISGCATSLRPSETSTSITKGPQAIAIVDTDDVRLQQLFIRGLTRALVDDHRQAIFLFEQAVQLNPRAAAIQVALAESHEALNELDAAVYYATQAVKLDQTNRSYTVYLGELLQKRGNSEEALTLLRGWLERHPEDVQAYLTAADLMIELGRESQALDVYSDLIARGAEELPVRNRMLQLYGGLGDLEGMRVTARRMLNVDPSNVSLRHLLAEVYTDMDSTAAAIDLLEKGLDRDPTDMNTTLLLSKLYREAGRHAEAENLVRDSRLDTQRQPVDRMTLASDLYARSESDVLAAHRAEELLGKMVDEGIETPDVLFMLGDLQLRTGDFLPAAELLLRAAETDPRRRDAWIKAASSFLEGGALLRAVDVAEESLVLFPADYSLLDVAARASLALGRPEETIDFATTALEAIRRDPGPSPEKVTKMLLLQASAYRLLGVPEGAETALREVLDRDPSQSDAIYWLAMSLLDQDGRQPDARAIVVKNLDKDADNPIFLDAMGWVEHISGNNLEALGWLKRAVRAKPESSRSQEHLGDVYSALGDIEMARKHWQKALDLEPGRVALKAKIEQHP